MLSRRRPRRLATCREIVLLPLPRSPLITIDLRLVIQEVLTRGGVTGVPHLRVPKQEGAASKAAPSVVLFLSSELCARRCSGRGQGRVLRFLRKPGYLPRSPPRSCGVLPERLSYTTTARISLTSTASVMRRRGDPAGPLVPLPPDASPS